MLVWFEVPIFKYVIGLFSELISFLKLKDGKSLGNLNLNQIRTQKW